MAVYVKVAQAADLPPGQAMAVTVADKRIALFSVDGTVFAIDDTCTHRGGPLSEGYLTGNQVICPWHGSRFNIKTGAVLTPPAQGGVKSFPVRVTGNDVEVEVE